MKAKMLKVRLAKANAAMDGLEKSIEAIEEKLIKEFLDTECPVKQGYSYKVRDTITDRIRYEKVHEVSDATDDAELLKAAIARGEKDVRDRRLADMHKDAALGELARRLKACGYDVRLEPDLVAYDLPDTDYTRVLVRLDRNMKGLALYTHKVINNVVYQAVMSYSVDAALQDFGRHLGQVQEELKK